MADAAALHRVRRLRWQARAPNAADAFALQSLLHRHSEDVSAAVAQALEQGLSRLGLSDTVWHLPSLTLQLDATSLAQMDADLPSLLASALQTALERAWPAAAAAAPQGKLTAPSGPAGTEPAPFAISSSVDSARAALRHYVATGSLPWALAGLGRETQQQTLQGAAQAALEAVLASDISDALLTEMLGASTTTPLAVRIGALLRWLPLLSETNRQRWLARSPRPAGIDTVLADSWFDAITRANAVPEWTALWLVWPTFHAQALHHADAADALAASRWIAALPPEIAAARLPLAMAPDVPLAAALRHALDDAAITPTAPPTAPPPARRQDQSQLNPGATAAPDTLLVPLAGLLLLHPFLLRFLDACGVINETTDRHIDEAALPRASALLHALACGDNVAAAEHQMPLIKLLLGRAPDHALTAALPQPTAADGAEIDSLLAAVRSHWPALSNTSAEGLRLSFLQRRGLLRRADGAWQMHMQAEGFDVLLGLLPWAISLVKLPWMPLPLMVEWHAP